MKYAKVFGILLSAGMLLVSCGEPVELGESVHLFGHITQEPIALMDYLVCDGEQTMRTGGTDDSLHVKLDGIWYGVPNLPGTVVWDYMPEIPAGETYEESCYIRNRYGDLPAGTYRVGIDVWSDEGDRAEKSAVYHEFTIE